MKDLLLEAIAQFLERDLKGQIADPRLAFRVLIAAHLANTIAIELRTEAEHTAAELASLRELLAEGGDLPALRRELAARLRDGRLAPERAMAHLQATLARRLQVVSPRFDLLEVIDP